VCRDGFRTKSIKKWMDAVMHIWRCLSSPVISFLTTGSALVSSFCRKDQETNKVDATII
jgi:hypothetical protein